MHGHLSSRERDAVSLFKSRLREICGDNIKRLVLFGSRARGEGTETSDIDLLVLLREESFMTQREILDEAAGIMLDREINLSPCIMSIEHFEKLKNLERAFARDIDTEGIEL